MPHRTLLILAATTMVGGSPTTAFAGKPGANAPRATRTRAKIDRSRTTAVVDPGKIPSLNHAYLLAHEGAIDTQIDLDAFIHADHTVSLWTMLQFPHGDFGPLLAENGSGTFLIGQADYRKGNYDKAAGKPGDPVMFVQVGGTRAYYLVPEADGGTWIHVAVVRRSGKFEMYINGARRSAFSKSGPASDVSVGGSYSKKPHGTLRLGRRTPGSNPSNRWQAYGFIDDLGIFRRSLSPAEIASLASTHRLSGKESGLWKGIGFDKVVGSTPLPKRLDNPIAPTPKKAKQFKVSKSRKPSDHATWDLPFTLMAMYPDLVQLPFEKNEVWRVTQGMDDPKISHNGYAVFSIDFSRVSSDGGCAHAPVVANAPGHVVRYRDNHNPPDSREGNKFHFLLSSQLGFTYMHLEYEGLASSITGGTWNDDKEMMEFAPGDGKFFAAGEYMGKIGDSACHLHIGGWDPAGGSIPQPYAEFEASTDNGDTWQPVIRGIPRTGMLVRRTKDLEFPKKLIKGVKGLQVKKK